MNIIMCIKLPCLWHYDSAFHKYWPIWDIIYHGKFKYICMFCLTVSMSQILLYLWHGVFLYEPDSATFMAWCTSVWARFCYIYGLVYFCMSQILLHLWHGVLLYAPDSAVSMTWCTSVWARFWCFYDIEIFCRFQILLYLWHDVLLYEPDSAVLMAWCTPACARFCCINGMMYSCLRQILLYLWHGVLLNGPDSAAFIYVYLTEYSTVWASLSCFMAGCTNVWVRFYYEPQSATLKAVYNCNFGFSKCNRVKVNLFLSICHSSKECSCHVVWKWVNRFTLHCTLKEITRQEHRNNFLSTNKVNILLWLMCNI